MFPTGTEPLRTSVFSLTLNFCDLNAFPDFTFFSSIEIQSNLRRSRSRNLYLHTKQGGKWQISSLISNGYLKPAANREIEYFRSMLQLAFSVFTFLRSHFILKGNASACIRLHCFEAILCKFEASFPHTVRDRRHAYDLHALAYHECHRILPYV